ncbi:MAG: Ppx/GppA family phosphatase [Micavibrio sp.]|nr:Ppx/GppA family phosphatase [Micavibrio sp.]
MPKSNGYVAIIDIGSNAVRLVVYDGLNRAPFKIHNERTQCHLGKDLGKTGRLNPDGIELALDAISRFSGLIKAMKIVEVRAVATAAMRDAADGPDFIKKVRDEFGLKIDVIEGEEEAHLAAHGVLMNGLGKRGIIGDYGGGSLELIVIEDEEVKQKASLPIGGHRLHAIEDAAERLTAVDDFLASVKFLPDYTGQDFYAMGGAWRSMGRAHMYAAKHPLLVLDHYAIDGAVATEFAENLSGQSIDELKGTLGIMEKRVHDMSVAALTMHRLFKIIKPARLIFSGTGLREGMLYDRLAPAVQKEDALLTSCEKIAQNVSRFDDMRGFERLTAWSLPLFKDQSDKFQRLLKASCLLSDMGWFETEDYQAELAYQRILVAPFYGIDHYDRAFLAYAAYVRYNGDDVATARKKLGDQLNDEMATKAELAGLAQRLGYMLTGGALILLKDSELEVADGMVTMKLKPAAKKLRAEYSVKALEKLSAAMGKGMQIEEV